MSTEFDEYANDYEAQLDRGISLSGEGQDYFARGRMNWLKKRLAGLSPRIDSVLDFGCGTGTSVPLLVTAMNAGHVTGVDVSQRSLDRAREGHGNGTVKFQLRSDEIDAGAFDLVFCNGVFHHIPRSERPHEVKWIFDRLRPGGFLAFWENNPWNPGTRWVMSRIPFDRDAVLVWPREAKALVNQAGFETIALDFNFIFPRRLAWCRFAEPPLCKFPLGAQYLLLARKPM